MPVYNLYSKRKRETERFGQADVYQYDAVPARLAGQIKYIWVDALGPELVQEGVFIPNPFWKNIHDTIAREKGVDSLYPSFDGYLDQCCRLLRLGNIDDALDVIELSFRLIAFHHPRLNDRQRKIYEIKITAEEAISELNYRFRDNGFGYQFENNQIIRIDNQLVHSEVIRPALTFLVSPMFHKANEEYLLAHEHYRHQKHQDAIVACQRAFETLIKTICELEEWPINKGDRAAELVTAIRNRGLFPDYLTKGFDAYVAMLKTGLPDLRNNAGGHGAAPKDGNVPEYIAAYALHMTATNILMLADAYEAMPK